MLIVGAGLVGLCTAAALARRGEKCVLISQRIAGEASPAAGMLAPSVERAGGAAEAFGVAARDRYPEFLEWVREATGVSIALDRRGILQLAATDGDAERMRAELEAGARWLSGEEVRRLEPALAPVAGAILHEGDGAVDNAALVEALRSFATRAPEVTVVEDRVVAIEPAGEAVSVTCASGRQYGGRAVVIAAGAWSGGLPGLRRTLPVEPVRGQMIALVGARLRHVVFAGGGYLVPRADGETLVGSTMERVGFDAGTTPAALAHLRGFAATVSQVLASAALVRHWSGLRPMTPDLQPIVGRDPGHPSLFYACGHSRNGILMAPLTGDCVAALLRGEQPGYDLSAFSPSRFTQVVTS